MYPLLNASPPTTFPTAIKACGSPSPNCSKTFETLVKENIAKILHKLTLSCSLYVTVLNGIAKSLLIGHPNCNTLEPTESNCQRKHCQDLAQINSFLLIVCHRTQRNCNVTLDWLQQSHPQCSALEPMESKTRYEGLLTDLGPSRGLERSAPPPLLPPATAGRVMCDSGGS